MLASARTRCRTLEAHDLQALPWESLLATLHEALAIPALIGELRRRYFPRGALAVGLLRLMVALLGQGERFTVLLSGVETKTLEANRTLEALAARVRADPTLRDAFRDRDAHELWSALEAHPPGRAFLAELRAFLDRYGHREGAALLASQPTWKDAPEVVLGILRGLAAVPPRHRTTQPAWEAARDELLARPLLRPQPLRAAFLTLLAQSRCLLQIREDTHFYATMPLPVVRRTLLELGRRLASVGVLDSAEDIFHLKRSEIEQVEETWPPPSRLAGELGALVLRRKERRSALERTPLHDTALIRPALRGEESVRAHVLVRGTPGSPGVAEGPVRVIREGGEFGKLRSGEVLVAPYTNPAWTPLFQRAAAVVVDSGNAASHAAVVAREYAIPAVMGTGDGTRRLSDGQWTQVDGTNGVVRLLDTR